jgi:hypothetical protein
MGSRSLADSHSLCNRLIVAARLTPVDSAFLLVSRPISTRAAAAVIEWSAGLFHGRGFAWKQFLQMDSAGNSRSPDRAEITDSSSHGGGLSSDHYFVQSRNEATGTRTGENETDSGFIGGLSARAMLNEWQLLPSRFV